MSREYVFKVYTKNHTTITLYLHQSILGLMEYYTIPKITIFFLIQLIGSSTDFLGWFLLSKWCSLCYANSKPMDHIFYKFSFPTYELLKENFMRIFYFLQFPFFKK